jgi:hypothetical protein
LIERVCLGNAEAMEWLARYWSPYVHAIDDIVDGDTPGAEALLRTFALAAQVYTHPFFLRHGLELRQLVINITILYADSVAWEKSAMPWQREWADHNRHVGMEVVVAVAHILGGYDHARAISREQRVICYVEHHDLEGKAI